MTSVMLKQPFAREVDMYPALLRLFEHLNVSVAEVPFFGKHIDLLFASPTFRSLYAIEAKLKDWRCAIKQAALNQIAAQRSYIAVPKTLADRLLERESILFLRYDVGLIAVRETANVIIPANQNECFSLSKHRIIKATLRRAISQRPKRIGVVAHALTKRSQTLVVLQTRAS